MRSPLLLALPILCSAFVLASSAATAGPAEPVLLSVSRADAIVRQISTDTAETLDASVQVSLAERTVQGVAAVATHPQTGVLYALVVLVGQTSHELATLDPFTGVADAIGDTGLALNALAFDPSGVLYAMTDEFSVPSGQLFTVDLSSAAPSLVLTFDVAGHGEGIAFDPVTDLLYRGSGHIGGCGTSEGICFETVDLLELPAAITDIPLTGAILEEQIEALVYWDFWDRFLWKQNHTGAGPLFLVSKDGSFVKIGDVDHLSHGLAFYVPEPRVQLLAVAALATLAGLRARAMRASSCRDPLE